MTSERFKEIIQNDEGHPFLAIKQDKLLLGMNLLSKYADRDSVLQGADHDVVYFGNIEDYTRRGITEEEVEQLRLWGFRLSDDEDYLQKSV